MPDYLTIDTASDDGSATHDSFDAKNAFYGGQVGLHYMLDGEYFRLEVTSKFPRWATPTNYWTSPAYPVCRPYAAGSTLPGGLYTASSNIGRSSTNRFGFVYEDAVNLVWKVSDCVQLMVGYDYLYWNDVYRSGNQVDHNLNPALNPALSVITPAGGPAARQRLNAQSDFWRRASPRASAFPSRHSFRSGFAPGPRNVNGRVSSPFQRRKFCSFLRLQDEAMTSSAGGA